MPAFDPGDAVPSSSSSADSSSDSPLVWRGTIAALSSAPGVAALSILRLSGPEALPIINCLLAPAAEPQPWQPGRAYYRSLQDRSGEMIDDVVLLYWRSPRSYTGEDTVEITCHGNPQIVERLMHELFSRGALPAQPGEFTRRAYLNNKLSLTQAEGVWDVLTAATPRALAGARAMKSGQLGRRLEALRSELIDMLSHLEASLDFSEEGIEPEVGVRFRSRLSLVQAEVDHLLKTAPLGRILREGARVVITGRPNVGKSSLLNALLREDRAIVSPTPGTTRDVIEASCNLRGLPLRLMDTAGRRETADPVEAEGVRRAEESLEQADLILHLLEPKPTDFSVVKEEGPATGWPPGIPRLLIVNKIDLIPEKRRVLPVGTWGISVQTGAGLEELEKAMEAALLGKAGGELSEGLTFDLTLNARQSSTLQRASDALRRAQETFETQLGFEALSIDLRDVLEALSEVIGETTNEDILSRLFRNFCIGK